jgi:hypothetical protein
MYLSEEKRGNRILLKDKYVFSTEGVLGTAKEAGEKTAASKACKRRKPSPITVEMIQTRVDMSESEMSEAESDCIVVATTSSYIPVLSYR